MTIDAESFGKYELLEKIGEGGMAEVYLAKSLGAAGLEKKLVIKKILSEHADRERFVGMFKTEAKIGVDLNHPNIVQVYDFGKIDGEFFLAMEYVDGFDLGDIISTNRASDSRLPIGLAVFIASQVAKGLHYAHNRTDDYGEPIDIIHRDITPQNILISRDGTIKVADFGIATASTVGEIDESVKGKYAYMSPEQASGEDVDKRTDLFSLGVVLFELITGERLFDRETKSETISLVKSGVVPDVSDLNPEVPEKLESLLYDMLERDPEARIETARRVQRKLKQILRDYDDIYDSMALSDYLREIESSIGNDGDTEPIEETGSRQTSVTNPGEDTTADMVTDVVETQAFSADTDWDDDFGQTQRRLPGEKKEVIVLHGDVNGFIDLRRSMRADQWTQIIQEYTRIVDSIAFKNEGLVERVNENGFVILLGLPISSSKDARRAAHMALDLQEAMEGINLSLDDRIELSIGIAIGRVFVENYSGGDRFEWSFSDESQKLARRFAEEGLKKETVLGGQVYRRVRREFECESIGDVDIELDTGKVLTPEGFRLEGVKSVSDRIEDLRRSYQTFVGRELKLKTLQRIFRNSVLDGKLQGILFTGEQGVGKSTLVEEFLSNLDAGNIRVVRTGVSPMQKDVPMGGLANVFARILRIEPEEDLRQIRDQLEKRISALFSNIEQQEYEMLLHSVGAIFGIEYQGSVFSSLDDDERRSRIFLTLRRLLKRYAAEMPMVIGIDDAHYFDSISLRFFTELLDVQRERPLMFIFTGTEPLEDVGSEWSAFKQADVLVHEQLDELSRLNSKRLIDELLSVHRVSNSDLIDQIYDKTGGNPLFIKEIIEILRDRGLLTRSADQQGMISDVESEQMLPANVEGLIRAHIDRLEPETREVLQRIALLWSPFNLDDVQLVTDELPEGAIDDLLEQQLLEPARQEERLKETDEESDSGWYRFTNRITKEVAQSSVAPELAEQLHLEIAEYLESDRNDDGIVDHARIARHFDAAGEPSRAVDYYYRAATHALERRGTNEALRLANIICDRVETTHSFYWRTQKLRINALKELGNHDEWKNTLDEMLELATSKEGSEHELEVYVELAEYYFNTNSYSEADDALERVNELSQETNQPTERLRAAEIKAKTLMNRGEGDRAITIIDSVIESYEDLLEDDDEVSRKIVLKGLANSLNIRGVLHRYGGDDHKAIEDTKRGLEISDEVQLGQLGRHLKGNQALASLYLGWLSDAIDSFSGLLEECRQLGYRRDEALTLINLGHAYQLLGDYDEAKSNIRRGVYLSRKTGLRRFVADGQITLGYVYLAEGQLERAAQVIQEGLRIADSIPSQYLSIHATLALARVRLKSGRPEKAKTALMQANDALERSEEADMWWGLSMGHSIKARALNALARKGEAIEASRRAIDYIDEGELFSVENIYYYHSQILPDESEHDDERREYIEKARDIVEFRLDALETEEQREKFLSKDMNRRILNTAELVVSSDGSDS